MHTPADTRLLQIAEARRAVMHEGRAAALSSAASHAWLERSWRRCLAAGQRPDQRVTFDVVPAQALRRVEEANRRLLDAARPVLDRLARAIASTRYFAIVTNHEGIVVDAKGPIDRGDRRAQLIMRTGVDLSERAVGTTAIGAALAELQPVWLHRGEHFFDDTACYSCAGAPLFGAQGECVGMLDLTGIDAMERPELRHLAAQSARSIGNALTLALPHRIVLRMTWPGRAPGSDDDAVAVLDEHGWVAGANQAAREMLAPLAQANVRVHCSELFGEPWEPLFDIAKRAAPAPVEMAMWTGLRVVVLPQPAGTRDASAAPLREVEVALIRKAVAEARGNVASAARALGISRATVYRKLAQKV